MAASIFSTITGGAFNAYQIYGQYKQHRTNGMGVLGAGMRAYLSWRVFQSGWMQLIPTGIGVARALGASANRFSRSVRMSTIPFGPMGRIVDTKELAQGRQALMQSAVASNSALSVSGHNWSGMEASVYHHLYD